MPVGDAISSLVVGADGGAWVSIARPGDSAIGRIDPAAGLIATTPITLPLSGDAALGADGRAWFGTAGQQLVGADTAGALTALDLGGGYVDGLAPGRDGTLWVTKIQSGSLEHVAPEGVVARTPFTFTGCEQRPRINDMARAADGAMWLTDRACGRLIRLAPDTSALQVVLRLDEIPNRLAADAAGGAWFTDEAQPAIRHVDAAGTVTRFAYDLRRGLATDVAVGPDGAAWFAVGSCVLGRVAAGAVTFVPAPVPAHALGFDPAGGLWLASRARVVRTTTAELDGAGCDATPPRVRIRPALGGSIRLAELRKGLKVELAEAARVSLTARYGQRAPRRLEQTFSSARTFTYRIPKLWLSRIESLVSARQRPRLTLFVDAVDSEGNVVTVGDEFRVRR